MTRSQVPVVSNLTQLAIVIAPPVVIEAMFPYWPEAPPAKSIAPETPDRVVCVGDPNSVID